jgi:hypothetical protein
MRERRRARGRRRGRDPATAADRLAEASVRDDAGRWAAVVAGALAGRR